MYTVKDTYCDEVLNEKVKLRAKPLHLVWRVLHGRLPTKLTLWITCSLQERHNSFGSCVISGRGLAWQHRWILHNTYASRWNSYTIFMMDSYIYSDERILWYGKIKGKNYEFSVVIGQIHVWLLAGYMWSVAQI